MSGEPRFSVGVCTWVQGETSRMKNGESLLWVCKSDRMGWWLSSAGLSCAFLNLNFMWESFKVLPFIFYVLFYRKGNGILKFSLFLYIQHRNISEWNRPLRTLINSFVYLFVCVHVTSCAMACVCGSQETIGAFFSSTYRFRGSNSGHQARRQVLLPAKLGCQIFNVKI